MIMAIFQGSRVHATVTPCVLNRKNIPYGSLYIEMEESKMAEQGTLTGKFKDGVTWEYKGDILNGIPNGKGKSVYSNGETYEGDVVNGLPNGKGKITFSDGAVYEGDMVNGSRHGKGKYTFPDGGYYEGNFVEDKVQGKGKKINSDGTTSEGDFLNGQLNGKGKRTLPNGGYYEGDFVEGKFHGKGKLVIPATVVYEGDFVNDLPHGKGKSVYPNGTSDEGDFVEGKFIRRAKAMEESKMAEAEKTSKEDLELDIWWEKKAKKILLICTLICCGLGIIGGVAYGISDGSFYSVLIGIASFGLWCGVGFGGAISLVPMFFSHQNAAHERGEGAENRSIIINLILFLFFWFVGPLGFLMRILRLNHRIKKFEKQLNALG